MTALHNLGSRLKVGTRITIGFASILALLGVVAGFGYYGLSTSESNVTRFDKVSGAYAYVANLENAVEQMRRSVILYGQGGAPELVQDVHKFQGLAEKYAAEAKTRIPYADRLEILDKAVGLLGQYSNNFALVVKAVIDKEHQSSIQRPLGVLLESRLNELLRSGTERKDVAIVALVAEAQAHLLSARMNVNIYFATPKPNFAKAVLDNSNQVPGLLKQIREAATTPEDQKRADEAIAAAGKFVPGLADTIKITDEKDRLIKEVGAKVAGQLNDQLQALNDAQMKVMDRITHETLSTVGWSMQALLGVAAAALVIGLALSFFLGRAISRPLVKMSGVLAELAKGNKAVEIPYTERGDEVGDNARAAQTVRD